MIVKSSQLNIALKSIVITFHRHVEGMFDLHDISHAHLYMKCLCFHRVKNTWHAFRKTMHEGGIRGLWRGCVPNVQRAALVNLGGIVTYHSIAFCSQETICLCNMHVHQVQMLLFNFDICSCSGCENDLKTFRYSVDGQF